MPLDDTSRLRHMLDAAEEAVDFAAGKTRPDLDRDRMLTLALVRLIEIIGEAAANVTPATQSAHPETPWRQIVGTRNRLIHAYFSINLDIRSHRPSRQSWGVGNLSAPMPPVVLVPDHH